VHAEPGERGQPRIEVAEGAGVDPVGQDGLDRSLELPPPLLEPRGPFPRQRRELVQDDPGVVGVAGDDVKQRVPEHRQLLRRRAAGLVDRLGTLDQVVHHEVVDGGEQLLLRPDVVVEGALAEPVRLAELGEARGVVAASSEDPR
jgi:hypothetical protein